MGLFIWGRVSCGLLVLVFCFCFLRQVLIPVQAGLRLAAILLPPGAKIIKPCHPSPDPHIYLLSECQMAGVWRCLNAMCRIGIRQALLLPLKHLSVLCVGTSVFSFTSYEEHSELPGTVVSLACSGALGLLLLPTCALLSLSSLPPVLPSPSHPLAAPHSVLLGDLKHPALVSVCLAHFTKHYVHRV